MVVSLPFSDEADLLSEVGWMRIGDHRILYPFATTYDGLPVAIYVKKSPKYPKEPPIIYLLPLTNYKVRDHLRQKSECCFPEIPPKDEIALVQIWLGCDVYVNGICRVHIGDWNPNVGNPICTAVRILEVRFGIRGVRI